MAVALDFRQEYIEYLDMVGIDITRSEIMQAQTITLNTQADPACMLLLSMLLLMYDEVSHTREYVLLNNKGFSPCAIIAAYQAQQPAPSTSAPINFSIEAYPDRYRKMRLTGYAGNHLLRKLVKQIGNTTVPENKPDIESKSCPEVRLRQKSHLSREKDGIIY